MPYDLTAFTGSRVRVGIFSSKQVDNGYATTALHDQRLLCVPAFTSISTSMITDWAKGDGGALRKKVVDKFTDTDFFKQVKETVDKHPLAKLGALRENSLALIGAVEVRMTAR